MIGVFIESDSDPPSGSLQGQPLGRLIKVTVPNVPLLSWPRCGADTCERIERRFHHTHSLLHHLPDGPRGFMRQEIGDLLSNRGHLVLLSLQIYDAVRLVNIVPAGEPPEDEE
jgi:hypothetical protein